MIRQIKVLIGTLNLFMHLYLWDHDDHEFIEPYKHFRYSLERFSHIYRPQLFALFKKWSAAVQIRDSNKLVKSGFSMLSHVDQPLQKLFRDLGHKPDQQEDAPVADPLESSAQNDEDHHESHISHNSQDRFLRFVKELCELSAEIRSCFHMIQI